MHLVDQVQVRRAVAPCRDLQFADRVYPVFGDQEFYREYHTFFPISEPQRDRTDPVERVRRKDLYLRRLRAGLPLPHAGQYAASVTYAEALCAPELTEEAMAWNLEAHKQTCNEDSSIWLLRAGSADLALLAGDSTDEVMRTALCGRQVHPRLQKLSHHGICSRYFSEYVQKLVRPEILVVSVDKTHYTKEMGTQVDALCAAGGSQAYYTFQGDVYLPVNLLRGSLWKS